MIHDVSLVMKQTANATGTDMENLTREQRETTAFGPDRVRVGFRSATGKPRKFYTQEAPDGWHVHRIPKGYAMTVSAGSGMEGGKRVVYHEIHMFDDSTDPVVIIDRMNFYEEWIDAKRMTLAAYLNTEAS